MILDTTVGKFVVHISHDALLGTTHVAMHADNGEKCEKPCKLVTLRGSADCAPCDQYCKRVGRKVAFAHALLNSDFDKPMRSAIWEAYKKTVRYQRVRG